jgi:hypothetical protein
MPQYKLHWITADHRSTRLLKIEDMAASDPASAQRKAMALFDDGGAIHGANRIELYEENAAAPFWSQPPTADTNRR